MITQNLYTKVYINSIQQMETTEMSFTRLMDVQTVACVVADADKSIIKANKLCIYAMTWIILKGVMLTERNPSQKLTYCVIPVI